MSIEMQRTLYPDWNPPELPKWMRRMRRGEKIAFLGKFRRVPGPVIEANSDDLDQLVPIIVVTGMRAQQLRTLLGRSVWREIHHASEATNVARARIFWRHVGRISWEDLVRIKPHNLQSIVYLHERVDLPAALFAGFRAARGRFRAVYGLYCDTVRMGGSPKANWTLRRLEKEHDALALKAAAAKSSPAQWAKPFVFEQDGCRFERLISDRDLSVEGLAQRNCIASYTDRAKRGDVVIFRITGAERATFAFDVTSKLHWVEIKGFANSEVSTGLKLTANTARKAFLNNGEGR